MSICLTCNLEPCINPPFCANCRAADTRKARSEQPRYIAPYSAPKPTVEALMYSLRERGTKALEETPTKRRISELAEPQLHEVCARLQRLKPHIAPAWVPEQVIVLIDAWNGCHG